MGNLFKSLINNAAYVLLSPKSYAKFIGVKIGKNCCIVTKDWGSEPFFVTIGDHVHVTRGVSFVNHDGSVWVFREKEPDFDVFGKIQVGNNTYIGNYAVIMPGVTIGSNCIIGAGSIVTKSIPDGCVVAGIPAKFISRTENFHLKMDLLNAKTHTLPAKMKLKRLRELSHEKLIHKSNLKID